MRLSAIRCQELLHPLMIERIEKALQVQIESTCLAIYVSYAAKQVRSRIQFTCVCVIATCSASSPSCCLRPGAKTIAEAEEIDFMDLLQDRHRRLLNNLVLQRCYPDRSLTTIILG